MKKKLLSIVLTLCMVLTMLPTELFTEAAATDDYGLWVGTTKVTTANQNNVTGPGITGTVTYDRIWSTLTLNNATITCAVTPGTGDSQSGIASTTGGIFKKDGELNIVLVGQNTINIDTISEGTTDYAGIYLANGSLGIRSTTTNASLTISNSINTARELSLIHI